MTPSNFWWCYFIMVETIHCSMNECFFINVQGNRHCIWTCFVYYLFCKTKIIPLKLIVTEARTNFVKDLYHQLHSNIMKQLSQSYMKRIVFLSIVYNIMDDLKYSVTFGSMRKVTFGSIRKQNIEEPLPWSRITCGIGLIADITVFCRIKCQFKMEFEHVTLVTQSFHTYLLVVRRTQFFCYICAIDAGRVKHLQFSTIVRVCEAYSATKMVNTHILQPAVCVGDI